MRKHKNSRERVYPVAGDLVEYTAVTGHLTGGVLAEVYTAPLGGQLRARVCDSHAETRDPEAGRHLDYSRLFRVADNV